MNEFDWRTIFLVIDIIVGCLGIFFNSLLLYLIVTQSPVMIHKYRILLINSTINDLVISLMIAILAPRIIGLDWTFVITSRGICPFLGRNACFVGAFILLATMSHFLFSLLLNFIFRMYVIRRPPPLSSKLFLLIFIILLPSILQIILAFTYLGSMKNKGELQKLISKMPTNTEGDVVYGVDDIRDWRISYALLMMTGCIIPIYIVIIFIRKRILNSLKKQTSSAKSVKLQAEILKVLSLQALLPLLFVISVGMYVVGQSVEWTHIIYECSILLSVSFIPILSPIITIFFVKPYRSWIIWHFGTMFRNSTVSSMPMNGST